MIEKEYYEEILLSLKDVISNTSDLLSIEADDYSTFITSNGKMDSRKKSFSVRFVLVTHNIQAIRLSEIMRDTFERILEWMNSFEDIYFTIHEFKSIGGQSPRLEFDVYFDNLVDISKRMLIK